MRYARRSWRGKKSMSTAEILATVPASGQALFLTRRDGPVNADGNNDTLIVRLCAAGPV